MVPYLKMFIFSNIGGGTAYHLITKRLLSVTATRKLLNTSGFIVASLALMTLPIFRTSPGAVICSYVALGFLALGRAGFAVNHMDIAPNIHDTGDALHFQLTWVLTLLNWGEDFSLSHFLASLSIKVTIGEEYAKWTYFQATFCESSSSSYLQTMKVPVGLVVFYVAQELGMMESGYAWIATAWLSTVLDSTSPLSSKTANSIQGALNLRPLTPDSERKRAFISRWNKLSNGSIGLNPYGLYAYDTVWMLAHAINLLLDQGGTISFSNITSLGDPKGGGTVNLVALSILHDRSPLNPAYDLINIIENGYQRIGYWSNYSGISVVPPETSSNRSTLNQQLTHYSIKLLPYAVPYEFVLFGDGLKNPSYYVFVNMIASGKFDAAVGDIAIITNRTKIVGFTQPYIASGLVVVASVRRLNLRAWAFLKPFGPLMWGVTGAFFLIIGLVMWILEHRINYEFSGPPGKQIVTILWFCFSTMLFAHASLTSMLTVQQLESPITGIDTLVTSTEPIGYQIGSFAQNYLVEELNIPRSRLVPLGSPEAYADALKKRTVAAVVEEKAYIDFFLSENCMFSIRGQEFTKSGWGFAFPRDSPLTIDMSTAILTL
ncbi:unnamed protein product [Prunus armeniaca]|uniref:Ionotropic glutamate receptor C-terminal domain-containing protein n=1 Tax=Prunus armeniaca TaxID=36596 RepID=A0A6J5VSY2_PRUAR|nr:unnamed protein product [Prunus armeniaca]